MARRRKGELSFHTKEKKIKPGMIKEWLGVFFWCVVAILAAFLLVFLLGNRCAVIGSSMAPTYVNGQEVLVNKISYLVFSPSRGDVIAFYPNGNEELHCYIKRVIGLPGETIRITNGSIYIDGERLDDERYSLGDIEEGGIASEDLHLGEHEFFVIGDNYNNSEDSRSGNIGTVNKEYIFGRVWFHLSKGDNKWGID